LYAAHDVFLGSDRCIDPVEQFGRWSFLTKDK
jgi:hypothetical protein